MKNNNWSIKIPVTLTILGILVPLIAFGQNVRLQTIPAQTTGIEHEDIGIVEEESGNEGKQDDDGDASVVQHNQTDFEFLSESAVSVKAVEVRGWDPKQKQEFLVTVKTYAEVKSGQELENFAKGVLVHDENIKSINLEEESTKVEYRMPAKLFGIFNSSHKVSVEADKQSRIKVKFPWFSFLFKKSVSAKELEADVKTALPEVDDEVIVGFENRIQTLLSISDVLKTKHDTVKNSINNVR